MASRRELLARIGRAAASRVFGAVQGAVSDLGKGTLERIASAPINRPASGNSESCFWLPIMRAMWRWDT